MRRAASSYSGHGAPRKSSSASSRQLCVMGLLADVYVCAERCADGPDDAADAELLHPAHVGLDIAPHAASALDGPVEAHWSVSAIDRA